VWTFELPGARLERRVFMVHGQNTTVVQYRLVERSDPILLEVEPWVHFRPHEGAVDTPAPAPYVVTITGARLEIACGALPPLHLQAFGAQASFAVAPQRAERIDYSIEGSRGYDAAGELYSVGAFRIALSPGRTAAVVATGEPWEALDRLPPEEAAACEASRRALLLRRTPRALRTGMAGALVLAADAFLIAPAGRVADRAHARARGDSIASVIAGYPWFTDWGRDTMIGLEGLALVTGRHAEAASILRTFARAVRDGLLPNLFPEGTSAGLYHTADATLWFFHAIDRYLAYTHDRAILDELLPVLLDIADHHERGTRFGIGVDPTDGLLRQGAPGYALTWMDAKVGNLVVTPRRGKAVEINALYYNALRHLASWTRERMPERSRALVAAADRAQASFNRRFWNDAAQGLFDVVDGERGDDASFRPNQVFAISLPHPVLAPSRWRAVIDGVQARLLTPVGLRTLVPGDPAYKPRYLGDVYARDLAYHQGTVWPWLIGPFVDAWLRVHPGEEAQASALLEGFAPAMDAGCAGTIAEIFDASPPFTGRGCVAQAWSVAEVLRACGKLAGVTGVTGGSLGTERSGARS
jgi:predicted glycogen debranching enzyme